ncbi:MAG: peptidylprolyl isomerase [Nitrospirales bacterium]
MTVQLLARVVYCSVLVLAPSYSLVLADDQETVSPLIVSDGKNISMEYSLSLVDKKVLDTNVGGEPMNFTQGSHQIIPGLESALEGMKVGESKQVTVDPEQGYGPINPQAVQEVPIDQIPTDARKVGVRLQGKDSQGRMVHPLVTEVKEQVVMLDFNHPLAGKKLFFDVKILDIQAADTSEPKP